MGKKYRRKPYAFAVRKGKNERVFHPNSVIELNQGEMMISHYAHYRVEPEYGGFVFELAIRNDPRGTKLHIIPDRDNYFEFKPSDSDILNSARLGSKIEDSDIDFVFNEIRLGLLLDRRYDVCVKGKGTLYTPYKTPRGAKKYRVEEKVRIIGPGFKRK